MNKAVINILLFCSFSIPFPFLAMYQDKFYRITVGYAIMLAALYIISTIAKLLTDSSLTIMLTGNIMSAIVSWYSLSIVIDEKNSAWAHYFKPFTPMQCLMIICVLNLVPQLQARQVAKWYQNRKKKLSSQVETTS